MQLFEQSILITGAGSGIGRATAVALGRKRAQLTLNGRRREPLEETARLVKAVGGKAEVAAGDISDETVQREAIATAIGAFDKLNVLINNAGNVRAGRLATVTDPEIRAMIELDLVAPILLTRMALPWLLRSRHGMIVNVTSGIALMGVPFYATYAAAKAGLARFGEALRRELKGEGVHVITVYPTATDTPMMASSKAGPDLGFNRESPDAVAEAIVEAMESETLEVVRGGETRLQMFDLNRSNPAALDERFLTLKPKLEDAVMDHRAL